MKMMIKREGGAGGSRGVQNGPKNFNPNFYETFRPRIFLPMDPLGGQGPRPRVRADGPLLLNPDPPPDVVILSRKWLQKDGFAKTTTATNSTTTTTTTTKSTTSTAMEISSKQTWKQLLSHSPKKSHWGETLIYPVFKGARLG
jgi:hypothetical protein